MTVCTQCRHENEATKQYCANCGMFIGSEGDPPPTEQLSVSGGEARAAANGAERQRAEFMRAQEEAHRAQAEAERVRAEAEQRARAATDAALRRAAEETRHARDLAFARAEEEVQAADHEARQQALATGIGGDVTAVVAQVREQAEAKARAEAELAELQAQRRARRAREEAYARARQEAADADRKAAEAAARAASLLAPEAPQPVDPAPPAPAAPFPQGASAPPTPVDPKQTSDLPLASTDEAVQAVQPAAPPRHFASPVEVELPPPPVAPTDLVCSSCGLGNDGQRRFCRRCGVSLFPGTATRRASWWQRLRRGRRGRAIPAGAGQDAAAGTAKKRSAPKVPRFKPSKQILAVVGLVGVAVLLGPYRRQVTAQVTRFRERVAPKPSYIDGSRAFTATGASQTDHHELIDQVVSLGEFSSTQTTSDPPPPGAAPLFSVEIGKDSNLKDPVNVFKMGMDTGYLNEKPPKRPTPHHVLLMAYGIDGRFEKRETISLRDTSSFQSFLFKVDHVHRVDVFVLDTYTGPDREGAPYVIDEIEFFERT